MSRIRLLLVASACSLLVFACGGGERPKAEPAPLAPAPAVQAAAPPPAPVEREPTGDELPVEEDFEAEAEQQISVDQLRAELDAIEKELDAEK